ncbi:MAG: DUF1576 domain-containing protein [Candidatus Hydrogenedentota bacterium]
MLEYEKSLYWLMALNIVAVALLGVACEGLVQPFHGFLRVQQHPARLISDFTVAGGIGGTLLNVAVMGFIALALVWMTDVRLSGPTIAAILTIMGFSFFGKTPVNTAPIILGVYLAGKLTGKPFQNFIIIALFGTALGPLVTYLVYEAGFTGIPALLVGLVGGTVTGLGLPALAVAMLKLHQGFNLYNIGLTSGFLGLFAASFFIAAQREMNVNVVWNDKPAFRLIVLVPGMSVLYVVWGALMDGRKTLAGLREIMTLSGRLPSDFMDMVTPGASLVNAGLLGLAGSLYLYVIGADFNGPTLGGLLTVMGFATFGKHPRNCWPVAVGVIAATLIFGKSLTAPGPVLALLFSTTLAPLAGEYGVLIGMAAGFTHLIMVERTAAWHGGLDLYNNGFAGGLTATFFVAIIEWIDSNRTK